MPYKRSTRRVKRYKGRKLTKTQKKQVKRIVGSREEGKYLDTNLGVGFSATTAATFNDLTVVAQGVGATQRTGDKIMSKRLNIRWNAIYGDATNFLRCIVFQWKANSASITPTAGAILENPAVPITSALNNTNDASTLYTVLYDKVYSLVGAGSNGAIARNITLYGKRLGRKVLNYNPTASSGFNHIYTLWFSDSNAVPSPSVYQYSRYDYTDS